MYDEHVAGVRLGGDVRHGSIPMGVTNPATEEVFAVVDSGSAADARAAADRAAKTFPSWAATSAAERARALRAAASALRDEPLDGLPRVVSLETGKRLEEARTEVVFSAGFFDWFADAAETEADEQRTSGGRRFVVRRKPVGVVAAMTPWNFPVSIPARKVAASLAAGCPTVLKPSELTPLSALHFAEILEPHLPAGVLTTVVGDGQELAEALIDHPDVAAVTFTGSTRVGALVAARCAPTFTRNTLELGGRAPFVVLDDADVKDAVDILVMAKYRNNGASCISANNVFAHESIYDEFLEAYVDRSLDLHLGDPLDEATDLGPMIGRDHVSRLQALVDDARARGARTWKQEAVPERGFFAPPVVVEAPEDMPLWDGEIFGPVTPLRRFSDERAVVSQINSWTFGLGGYVCSSDPAHGEAVAAALDIGIVGINTGAPNSPEVPFGGFKHSGVGREGGVEGLHEFTEAQTLSIGGF